MFEIGRHKKFDTGSLIWFSIWPMDLSFSKAFQPIERGNNTFL